jgi:hypothetical protein
MPETFRPSGGRSVDGALLRSLATPEYALELGKAAEHLVCADLILSGYRAFLSDQGLPYDVLVETGGRIIRVQVKGACFTRNMNADGKNERFGYTFNVRRRGKNGKSTRLSADHCDLVACVALDIRTVAYLPLAEVSQCVQLMPPCTVFAGKFKRSRIVSIDKMPFSEALQRCGGAK